MHAVLRSCSPSSASMSRIPSWLAFNPFGTFRFNQVDEPLDETRKPRETIPEEDGGVISPHGSPTWLPTRAQGEKLKARTRPAPALPWPGTSLALTRARALHARALVLPSNFRSKPLAASARACTDTALSGRRGVPSSSGRCYRWYWSPATQSVASMVYHRTVSRLHMPMNRQVRQGKRSCASTVRPAAAARGATSSQKISNLEGSQLVSMFTMVAPTVAPCQ